MSAGPTDGGVAPGPVVVDGISIRQVECARWELIQATVEVPVEGRYWRVIHEPARRTSLLRPGVVESETLTTSGAGSGTPVGCVFYRLTDSDIVSQVQVNGDRDSAHFLPGGAAETDLSVNSGEVVAHDLLLGAISLALVQPPPSRQVGPIFIGSTDVPTFEYSAKGSWMMLAVDPVSGNITQDRRPVLCRQ